MYGSDGITVLRVFSPLTGDIYKKDEVTVLDTAGGAEAAFTAKRNKL